jgi:hypothetical protein
MSTIDLSLDLSVEEAAAIVEAFCRKDDALQAAQRKAKGPEGERIAQQRRTLRQRMIEEVAEVARRHGLECDSRWFSAGSRRLAWETCLGSAGLVAENGGGRGEAGIR